MYWTKAQVEYRLCYWTFFKNYMMGAAVEPIPKVHKRIRRSTDPPFVGLALENAFVDEAFSILTPLEQRFLVELYIDNGEDVSQGDIIKIEVPMDAWEAVARKSNIDPFTMQKIADNGIARMVSYLNEHE